MSGDAWITLATLLVMMAVMVRGIASPPAAIVGATAFVFAVGVIDAESALHYAETFYAEWCAGTPAAASAAAARRSLRARRPHPFAWAPFVTVG